MRKIDWLEVLFVACFVGIIMGLFSNSFDYAIGFGLGKDRNCITLSKIIMLP